MLNRKVMIIYLIARLIKMIFYKMIKYFPKPYESFGGDSNVKVDLFNYAKKLDLKNATEIDTSNLAAKFDLASLKANINKVDRHKLRTVPENLNNLKSKADKLEVDELVLVPVNLSKLSNVVKNDFVNKDI